MLKKYRKENFAEKRLVYSERKAIGKCPVTPKEVISFCHRLYMARITIRADRKGLAPIFIDRENGHTAGLKKLLGMLCSKQTLVVLASEFHLNRFYNAGFREHCNFIFGIMSMKDDKDWDEKAKGKN
ncbi:hypothetical protein GH714_022627 [Hevea brasiliensis]|uniref:Uncharacterized protein n=1 Tax=Hevea brasiliensis TaxID=3981 RepID=A0A6A6KKR0_HEVBR|nr:hypothetical protein GH714_022627 [Hevea brasiliensis]